MTRTGKAMVPALGLAAALALAGCGAGPDGAAAGPNGAAAAADGVTDEVVALQQAGFDTDLAGTDLAGTDLAGTDLADVPDPSPSASAGGRAARPQGARHRAVRPYLRRTTLHGEIAVQTKKNGVRTIVVQRGAVTAVHGATLTVRSTDGYELTWTLAPKATVVQNRARTTAAALKAGEQVGVAGVKDGSADQARLVQIR
jgi:hypothetical protein